MNRDRLDKDRKLRVASVPAGKGWGNTSNQGSIQTAKETVRWREIRIGDHRRGKQRLNPIQTGGGALEALPNFKVK